MRIAMIAAGGEGRRVGADIPKQYVEVLGKPIIAYTMEAFQASPEIDRIQVVCKEAYMPLVRGLAARLGIDKLAYLTPGGREFQDSIRNGVYALREDLQDEDLVMMHPSVMPMITERTIREGLALAEKKGASFAMFPVRFCLARRTAEDHSDACVYKEDYLELNAPWSFRYGEVYALYKEAEARHAGEDVKDYTLNLWMDAGHPAYYFQGDDAASLKITTPFDLELFEALLRVREKNAGGEDK